MTNEQLYAQLTQANDESSKGNLDLAEQLANDVLKELDRQVDRAEQITERFPIRIRTLITLAEVERQRGNFHAALDLAYRALGLAETHNLSSFQAKASNTIGIVYQSLGNYAQALEYYSRSLATREELGDRSGVARVTGNIGVVYWRLGNYTEALEYMGRSLAKHEELGEKSEVVRVTGNIGIVYANLGNYAQALEYYSRSLAQHEELGEKSGVALVTGNIGNVYANLGNYAQALEYFTRALATHEELGNKSGVADVTGNIGNVYAILGNYAQALEYFTRTLATHEELGNKSGVAYITGNIGSVYASLGSCDQALEYLGQALALHIELGKKSFVAAVTGIIGELYSKIEWDGYDAAKAEEYLRKAIAMNEELGTKQNLYGNHKAIAELYKAQERWEESLFHFEKYHDIEKEVQSEETKKQAERLDFERKQVEREKQLAVERAKHEATEKLLHNVLPPSIAHRMIAGESLIAEKLSNVSVLFADIVNFTTLSSRITAEELVAGLDSIFSSFDALAEKHGLEKIKTIGDAYMVVAGAPEARSDHAQATAFMAVEMMETMHQFTSIATGEEIQIRIGIHSGSVVAGVIGKKKFAYDLWGDAVNTASRMESHGEAGKIHCSEAFARELGMTNEELGMKEGDAQHVIRNSQFVISLRGEMEIKGKGMMKTYFLERNDRE